MVDTVSYEEIDRMIYEPLRLAVVAAGLLPNVEAFSGPTADDDYLAARVALKASLATQGKKMVDVFGVGSWDDKQEKTDARIVIRRTSEKPGSIGGYPAIYYEPYTDEAGNPKFTKSYYPDMSTHVDYEVRVVSNHVNMERTLSKIVHNALGGRRYLKTVNSAGQFTDKRLLVLNAGGFDLSDQKYIEKGYRYTVEDAFIQEPTLIMDNIVPMTTVQFVLYLPNTPIQSILHNVQASQGFPLPLPFHF